MLAAFVALGQRDSEFHEFSRGLAHAPERAHLSSFIELPHQPYHFLPSGQRYPDALGELPGLGADWTRNRWLARQGFQRYLLQVGYADRLLGEAIEQLPPGGRYDRSLIVNG